MSDLVLPINNGKTVETNTTSSTSKASNNELGKDAFLQLLVTQMKYQDPLNPNTDTEYIAQLATFSQLEQLQNLGKAASSSQAFSLVGKTVDVKATSDSSGTSYITGKVDSVLTQGSKIQLSIGGKLYSFDQLDTVYSDDYIDKLNRPSMEATELKYDADNPKDFSFTVNLGSGDTIADEVAVGLGNYFINSDYVKLNGNKVTIDKAAFAEFPNGTYKLTVAFNDSKYTTVKDKLILQVTNSKVTELPEAEETETEETVTDETVTEEAKYSEAVGDGSEGQE